MFIMSLIFPSGIFLSIMCWAKYYIDLLFLMVDYQMNHSYMTQQLDVYKIYYFICIIFDVSD